MNTVFSEHIKELRSSMKMNQADFSRLIGTNQSTLSAYENGDRFPPYETLILISRQCRVSLDWLCGLSDIVTPNGRLEKYSDIIRVLFKIESAHIDGFSIKTYLDSYETKISEISFEDDKIYDFLSDWQKMREVHSKCIIDNEMYDLWIEKTLRNYNTAINRESLPFD